MYSIHSNLCVSKRDTLDSCLPIRLFFSKPVFFFFNSQTLESLHWHLRYGSHSATCWCAALDAGSGTFKVSFASNVLF